MTDRKTRWFDDGASAYRRALLKVGLSAEIAAHNLQFPTGGYVCPCCLAAFDPAALTDGRLSIEHVPPHAVGGDAMLLSCTKGNNTAGSVWDAHAARQRELHEATMGSGAVNATLTVGGLPVRGTFDSRGAMPTFTWTPKINNPDAAVAAGQALKEAMQGGDSFDIQLEHHSMILADAAAWSWLRAAYLAAFAVYGYSYARLSELDSIRAQLAGPRHAPVPQLVHEVQFPSGLATPAMLLVHEPVEVAGLLVDFGPVRVLLPDPERPRSIADLEEGLRHVLSRPVTLMVTGDVGWPAEPQYTLDI